MDNLIRLALFFNEDPKKLFRIAGKDEFVELYRQCVPDARPRRLTEDDLYKNPRHADYHRRVQRVIRRGHEDELEEWLRGQDRLDLMSIRLEETVRLTKSKRGVLCIELQDPAGNSLVDMPVGVAPANEVVNPLVIDGHTVDLSWIKKPGKTWRSYQHTDKQEDGSIIAYLLLERPTMASYLEKLIETYLREWAAAATVDI
jgi:hypothetical protein